MNCLKNSAEYSLREKYLVTLDGGTTNTRSYLWKMDGTYCGAAGRSLGGRNAAISGDSSLLKSTVKECVEEMLRKHGVEAEEVLGIFCSGMLTSKVGLYEIPHLIMPVDKEKLCGNIRRVILPDISEVPFYMIPGAKNLEDNKDEGILAEMDMMRGEEIEVMALQKKYPKGKEYIFVLPGSHMKIVGVNKAGEMYRCLTTMSGELLSVLAEKTILKESVADHLPGEEEYDKEAVLLGAMSSVERSMAEAVFRTRIYQMFLVNEPIKASNFLLGVLMYQDCLCIKKFRDRYASKGAKIIISGRACMVKALKDILEALWKEKEVVVSEEQGILAAEGAFQLAESYFEKYGY